MVSSGRLIMVIAETLQRYHAANIVLDPVMVSTSGSKLINEEAIQVLKEKMLPLATVITPNIPETEVLWGRAVTSAQDMEKAAADISDQYGTAVLCKGGHRQNDADDLLCADGKMQWFKGRRVDNPNTHGTGCTLSSAIASYLARGFSLAEAVQKAKEYTAGALEVGLDLGEGSGPLNHGYII